jgi:hypothetical protein
VQKDEGKRFAEQYKMNFLETSAKERTDVDKAFQILLSGKFCQNFKIN